MTAREQAAADELKRMIAELDAAAAAAVLAIIDAEDGVTVAARIRAYYRDRDRADRTPRGLMYLHLGMLLGVIEALLDAKGFRH